MKYENMKIEINKLSNKYDVRKLGLNDINAVYELCRKNKLYYDYCPPFVTKEGVKEDMEALPPGKTYDDKYFVGYYDGEALVAIMDIISGYPNEETLYIGLFMTDVSLQGKGVGTKIIDELSEYIAGIGFERMELAWVKGNPQAEGFWTKNKFVPIGERSSNAAEHVIAAERKL